MIRMGKFAAILAYILFTTMFLTMAGPANAQDKPSKEITFTLSGTYSIGEIFDLMHSQTGIYVNREHSIVDLKKKLTVHFRNTTIREVMDKVLGDYPVDWMFSSGDIILFESKNPDRRKEEEPVTVLGMITDKEGSPLPGVTVIVRGEQKGGVSDGNGRFKIERVPPKSTLVVNSIGFLSRQYRLDGERKVHFVLEPAVSMIDPVEVTGNTGYQVLKKKQTPGAVSVIDSGFINRSTSFNILDRLEGGASGLIFLRTPEMAQYVSRLPDGADMGVYLRGFSTISPNKVNPNPLIVLDNFPYEGDIRNINPNDITNVTILKDATAAGVWGARSGNGVIVLTTKKGEYKEKMKVDFTTSFSLSMKPRLSYDRNYMSASDYIEVERLLYSQGYFTSDLSNTSTFPMISPVVEILDRQNKGELSQIQAENLLDRLKRNDLRSDIGRYSYRKALSQQYSIGIRGGTKDFTYYVSLGHDRNQSSMVRNRTERTTLISSNQFKPIKNLEVSTLLNFSQQKIDAGNEINPKRMQMDGGKYKFMYPYASFFDESGHKSSIDHNLRGSFTDSLGKLGFLDWKYRPYDEINNVHNNFSLQNLLLRATVKYSFLRYFNVEMNYQNERQMIFNQKYWDADSYYARNLINTYTVYNQTTKTINRALPLGGMMAIGDYDWRANSFRISTNFQRQYNSHIINAVLGGEIREMSATGFDRESVGYDNAKGIPVTNLNPSQIFPITPSGNATFRERINLAGENDGMLNRYLSAFVIINYNFLRKYDLTVIGRKDGTNMFGARTNESMRPFWSVGAGWHIDKEEFFHSEIVNTLRLRSSIGENGNINNSSAYLTATRGVDPLTGLPSSLIGNPANEDLSWEKVNMLNVGVDFTMFKQRLSGSIDVFSKNTTDLVQRIALAPQTGYTGAFLNSAEMKAKGLEATINGMWKIKKIQWYTRLNVAYITDKLTVYELPPSRQNIILNDPFFEVVFVKGSSLKGIFSYKWAGLDPKNGDPQGYFNGQVSKDYTRILNNSSPDSLVYHGSAFPKWFGVIRNDFNYKNFNLSVGISYKLHYYFRRSSIELGYADILNRSMNVDYQERWQRPGDELNTHVPSLVYPSNEARNQFYQRSEVLVQRGDHIRLQDVRLSYQSPEKEKGLFRKYDIFCFASNLGILWRANKLRLDPDVTHANLNAGFFPQPLSISIGANLKL